MSGTVQELAVHTIGGVVASAQALLVIVPDDAGLEVDAQILNRDIGFVRPGQDAEIKLDAFPYTHYGTIAGRVMSISQLKDPLLTFTEKPYDNPCLSLDQTLKTPTRSRSDRPSR
ncbi:HlyD family efflux transporter periplasmic adaptor subunit [Pseudomonas gingeri]